MPTGVVYGVQVAPPSSDHSTVSTPLVASLAARVTGTAPACQPASFGGANEAVVTGAVASTLKPADRAVSTLPARSTDRYARVWVPSAETVTGPVYGVQAVALSSWYSVRSSPLPPAGSAADSVTTTGVVYQPLRPSGAAGASAAVVTGAAVSPT